MPVAQPHRIVVVGGGAGGLELATRLGDSLVRKGHAEVTLVDRARTHLWKPLLHEVAAGSINIHSDQLDYLAQARWHHFTFALGELAGLDRSTHTLNVAAVIDDEGVEILPARALQYDTLIFAIGSQSNDFGTPGVADHAFMLDNAWEANLFHRRLVNACFKANFAADNRVLNITIVGAGATGVELAAELHNTTRVLAAYGLKNFDPARQIRLRIVEAGPRILAGLPDYLADATVDILRELGVEVNVNERVVDVGPANIRTASGQDFPADFTVWAAGIKCAQILAGIGGLETNRINQLVVKPTLQTTLDADIFALGDCAACEWKDGRNVPPRAQSAHQMASHIAKSIHRRLNGREPTAFHYRDFGSLVSLGSYESVGTLMGFVSRGSIRVEGIIAKLFYISLYKLHLWALHGFWRMALDTLARMIRTQTEPKVKLH
jgi:NADH:ubiquinone reductase (H+-translocating)